MTKADVLRCEGCHLQEDGIRVRNVCVRPSGRRLCADCAVLTRPKRLAEAQAEYRAELARRVAGGATVPFSLFM